MIWLALALTPVALFLLCLLIAWAVEHYEPRQRRQSAFGEGFGDGLRDPSGGGPFAFFL